MTPIVAREDPYPSRVGEVARVLPRKDPVVYPARRGSGRGPLSAVQLDCFERRGGLCLDAVVSRDGVTELMQRAERLRSRPPRDSEAVVLEPEDAEVRSIFAVHQSDACFADFVNDSQVQGLAEQLLGGPVYVHQSRINYKPAFAGQEFYWHSDFETWHVEDGMPRMRACSLSLNLTENRPENGPVMFIPGSHRHFVSCAGTTPEDNYKRSLRRQDVGVPPPEILERLVRDGGLESPTGEVGSALLFDSNLMHGSNSNITPFARTNLFVVFNSVENALESPFSDRAPRPEFVATRSALPVGFPLG